jgi:hypothetical protein
VIEALERAAQQKRKIKMKDLIYRAAGKKKNAIWGIDEAEGGCIVWLKDDYIQRGYNAASFCVDEDDELEAIEYYFSLVEKA